ncbi:MAG: hydroxyacid dehydrogenase [Clostridia bacterium]|nr:hydroxyacid dehydrogenase [Clostridia bacterium]
MKAAYLCANPGAISYVYAGKQHGMVEERVDLLPGVFTSIKDERLKDVEAVFSTWGMPVCTEEEIRRYLPKLRYVFYAAGTVQAFARPFLKCGVRVFSAWQANAVPVVEFAHAQIMLALKGYFQTRQAMKHGRSEGRNVFGNYPGVFDVKVGLLGCGAIGSRVAEKLKDSDAEVLVFDPFLSDERAAALNVRKTDLDEIFAECDVVSNHLANLPETVGIIRREHLLSMKPYSTFINTGRGPQLDEKDLYDMLTSDKTRFALLDVMTDEENSDSNPLNGLDNCWITPHIAGSSGNEVRRMAEYMIEAYEKAQAGEACSYEVTERMLETMA